MVWDFFLFYIVIFWQLPHDKFHIYEESNCTFSSYVDFVNYMSHIPKKKRLNMKKSPFYAKLVHKIFLDHGICLRKHCEIYKKNSVMQRSKCCVEKD